MDILQLQWTVTDTKYYGMELTHTPADPNNEINHKRLILYSRSYMSHLAK